MPGWTEIPTFYPRMVPLLPLQGTPLSPQHTEGGARTLGVASPQEAWQNPEGYS